MRESPAYRRLWSTQAVSAIGSVVASVAVAVQVYDLTRSSLAVGLVGLAAGLPQLVFGLLGGAIADAMDRRKVVIITTMSLAAVASLFAAQAWLDLGQVWILYVLTVAQASLSAIATPAFRTFMPRLVRQELFPAASALTQLSFQTSLVVGALAGGVIVGSLGTTTAFWCNAASFVVAVYGVARLPVMPVEQTEAAKPAVSIGAIVAGLRFVRHNRMIGMVLLADINATILAMPQALFPALVATQFDGGAEVLGLFYAAPAIGGVLAATVSGHLSHVRRQGLAVIVAIAVWGIALTFFALTSMVWLAVALLVVAGGADMVNGVFRSTLLQVHAPDEMRGRVNAVGYVVGFAGPNLGGVRAGAVASMASPVVSAALGGLMCLGGAVAIALAAPSFLRYRSKEATES